MTIGFEKITCQKKEVKIEPPLSNQGSLVRLFSSDHILSDRCVHFSMSTFFLDLGLLIAKKSVFRNPVPGGCGGGTVLFVS